MQITSDFTRDRRTADKPDGSYEWWYFDGLTPDSKYCFTVIFYEGNPFSGRYIRALDTGTAELCQKPSCYPAVSISVYLHGEPIYYGFIEHEKGHAEFHARKISGRVGESEFSGTREEDRIHYRLRLNQKLPSNDSIQGVLEFTSPAIKYREGLNISDENQEYDPERESLHSWNLVQPRAKVKGEISIKGYRSYSIRFEGNGYHDHNLGMKSLDHRFHDWYWGRFHFEDSCLIYYLMNTTAGPRYHAWLLQNDGPMVALEKKFSLEDRGLSFFGLQSARKLSIEGERIKCLIQQEQILDNGPFYQRFLSSILMERGSGLAHAAGITEYLYPGRIRNRLFRKLIDMRIGYPGRTSRVQHSPGLYRWTW